MVYKLSWLLLLVFPVAALQVQAQELTLEQCYSLAGENYPLIKRYELVKATSQYSLENAGKVYLPQLSFSGAATYQSDVVQFPDILPPGSNIKLPVFSKDQYKLVGEVSQTIYDGSAAHYKKENIRANAAADKQNVTVNMYAIRDRINQLYFSVLLMDEQRKQNALQISDLNNAIEKVSASYRNGTAYRSNVDELKAEMSTARSQDITFRANRNAYLKMLSIFVGKELPESTQLQMPAEQATTAEINRPELEWYKYRRKVTDTEEKQLKADYLPKFSAFFQGAYGRPTLNILSNDFGPWYITGLRMSWNLGSLYGLKNNRRILEENRKSIAVEEETFLFNTRLSMVQEDGDIRKYKEIIVEDEEAISLRAAVKQSAKAQLDNGVITVHDYIAQLNAENQAKQLLILHKLQLLQAGYQYKFTSGN
ncbi:outer membrane protein TolC [Chitinophaga dinghuensis]|uniref:Outer membrane protein TolC n=1 Tax=Chitinophaga dinghuensis TaxID=1539050 RepID=A0A327W2F6_9BACT|nr:TolC family protein [Chitinophaga dinghuensis]RAJ79118.1 outer membrane protein TolC [Chitinophaga dinghuensis]